MENKDIVIIALIVVIIYLYYQQNNQPNISSNGQETKELQKQVQHYQTLYQKRVEKDVGDEEVIKIKDQKITSLENSLLNLAKQKVKGKKAAEQPLTNLETNWSQKEIGWNNKETDYLATIKENQEQLRKINLLFDEKSQGYEFIDFNGLYSLLSSIAERERERERERESKSK